MKKHSDKIYAFSQYIATPPCQVLIMSYAWILLLAAQVVRLAAAMRARKNLAPSGFGPLSVNIQPQFAKSDIHVGFVARFFRLAPSGLQISPQQQYPMHSITRTWRRRLKHIYTQLCIFSCQECYTGSYLKCDSGCMHISRLLQPAGLVVEKTNGKSATEGGFSDIEAGCRRRGPKP